MTAREERITKLIADAPQSVRKTLRDAFSGAASPRGAIRAQCLICVGYDREAIRACTGFSCPLWAYRPFQEGEKETAAGAETRAAEDSGTDRARDSTPAGARGQRASP